MEKLGKKIKHDHTLTNILKFAIFSIVMLAPIFSVATRCLYVICNKNAKDSYSGTNLVEKQLIDIDNMNTYSQYSFNITSVSVLFYNNASYMNINEIQDIGFGNTTQDTTLKNNIDNIKKIYFMNNGTTNGYVSFRDENNTIILNVSIASSNTLYFEFTITGYYFTDDNLWNYIKQIKYTQDYYIDNAFEYSLSQLQESSFYNWTSNLGIYTPINNMITGLGAHEIVSLLLAYWSIYTAIYIVFDIIITVFVKITHLLQGE